MSQSLSKIKRTPRKPEPVVVSVSVAPVASEGDIPESKLPDVLPDVLDDVPVVKKVPPRRFVKKSATEEE